MTAPRTCRACGSPLEGNVRWCLRCYEPSRELTPRAPTWAPGEFVDAPIHTGGAVPHWSRWEKSPTTMGALGRIVSTLALFSSLPVATMFGMFLYVIWFPVIAVVGLNGIWAKGWVVPGAEQAPPPEIPSAWADWLWNRDEALRMVLLILIGSAVCATLLYVPSAVVRFVVIVTSVVVASFVIFKKLDGSR